MITSKQSVILDSLRGVSAIAVAVCHVVEVYWAPLQGANHWSVLLASTISLYAVGVFFFLSGVMITDSIAKRTRGGVFEWRSYVAARFNRIYPPLLYAMALTGVVIATMNMSGLAGHLTAGPGGFVARGPGDVHTTMYELVGSLTLSYRILLPYDYFMKFDGPLWTLSSEAWLYVFAGLTAHTISIRGGWTAAALLALAVIIVTLQFPYPLWDFLAFSAVWCFGSLLHVIIPFGAKATARYTRYMPITCATVLALLLCRYSSYFLIRPFESLHGHLGFVAGMGMIAAAIAGWLLRETPLPRPALARTADFSYTLYLIHFPILVLGYSIAKNAGSALLSLAVSILISKLSWCFVENRSQMRVARRWLESTTNAAVGRLRTLAGIRD